MKMTYASLADIQEPTEAPATKSGASLYIIIAIIAIVVLLCALFYCCRYWRKKNNNDNVAELEKPTPTPKDAEEGQAVPLINKEQNQQEQNQAGEETQQKAEGKILRVIFITSNLRLLKIPPWLPKSTNRTRTLRLISLFRSNVIVMRAKLSRSANGGRARATSLSCGQIDA